MGDDWSIELARNNDVEQLIHFLDHRKSQGVDIDVNITDDWTLLHAAAKCSKGSSRYKIFKTLLTNWADPNDEKYLYEHTASLLA